MDQEKPTCAVCGKPITTRNAMHVLTYQDKDTGKYVDPDHYVHMDPEEGAPSGCGFGYNDKFNARDVVMVEVDLPEALKKVQK